ncbi:hypothetical protein [Ammoniphilus resinae]|uniref:Uncharacterized protein n=1 Tax=Ammoniphilus resinae TaxID=861532 RepID=A0ABS4GTT1_9BACL|nr:hypothetical protein [Ammoniphilus resinae]MBP1933688.1 hypothetical protein [Ammoniphilus resinae]
MERKITEEQENVLRKFGFSVLEDRVHHKKMGIEKPLAEIVKYGSVEDLQDYIKTILRAS